jgi:GH15 family glucan-1,4-alpha-glucosidase
LAGGRLGINDRAAFWVGQAAELREPILARAWNPARGAPTGVLDGDELDASLLLLAELGLVAVTDPRFIRPHNAIGRELCRNGRIMRYTNDDGFGAPEAAFLVYNFWYVDALAVIGRRDEARVLFIDLLAHRNAFALLSEDIHPEARALWGNILQTYSTAGTVNSAMRLSVRWKDVWCLVSS